MKAQYIFITILGIFCAILVIVGFFTFGNPFELGAKKDDIRKIEVMTQVKNEIEINFQKTQKLPQDSADFAKLNTTPDPVTHKPFDYIKLSESSYKLCTTFSTDTKKNNQQAVTEQLAYGGESLLHKKGYDCAIFNVQTNNALNQQNLVGYTLVGNESKAIGNGIRLSLVSVKTPPNDNRFLNVGIKIDNSESTSGSVDLSKIEMSSGSAAIINPEASKKNAFAPVQDSVIEYDTFEKIGNPPFTFYFKASPTQDVYLGQAN